MGIDNKEKEVRTATTLQACRWLKQNLLAFLVLSEEDMILLDEMIDALKDFLLNKD